MAGKWGVKRKGAEDSFDLQRRRTVFPFPSIVRLRSRYRPIQDLQARKRALPPGLQAAWAKVFVKYPVRRGQKLLLPLGFPRRKILLLAKRPNIVAIVLYLEPPP